MDKLSLLAALFLFACGALPDEVDAADDLSTLRPGSVFRLSGAPASGELLYLQLAAGGRFAWTRCPDAACADPVREDGTWQSGHGTLRFFQQGPKGDPSPHLQATYAYAVKGGKLWLRAQGAAFAMEKVTEPQLCSASGGAWTSAAACDCGKGWPTAWSPGAGGCWQSPAVSEEACDATQGSWTDDDATLIGTYCECGIGRRLTAAGCAPPTAG